MCNPTNSVKNRDVPINVLQLLQIINSNLTEGFLNRIFGTIAL